MPDLLTVFVRWWKTIALLTLIATAIAAVAVLIKPKEYASMVTALPSSTYNTDKARIFNEQIQSLYSDIGSADDLDRIVGTANLDTIYIAVAAEKKLAGHYEVKDRSVINAARILKKNSKVSKSEYGQLKIKVWDKDRYVAADLANALFQHLQSIHQTLEGQNNALVLQKIKEDYAARQQQYGQLVDSLKNATGVMADILMVRKTAQLEQLQQYEKLLAEYDLIVKANPPVLMVIESAQPEIDADRPKVLETLALVFFAALLFSFLVSLYMETKQKSA